MKNKAIMPVAELEQLYRDSEKVRILQQALLDGVDIGDYWLGCILGIQQLEVEELPWKDMEDIPECEQSQIDEIVLCSEPVENDVKEDVPAQGGQVPEKRAHGGSKKKLDRGKILALHNAGWTNAKIADELGCAPSSISMILKDMRGE